MKMPSLLEMRTEYDKATLESRTGNEFAAGVARALGWALGKYHTPPGRLTSEEARLAETFKKSKGA
jgi:hypothetical protein